MGAFSVLFLRGGKPVMAMAMAGGTNPAALPTALASVQAWLNERV